MTVTRRDQSREGPMAASRPGRAAGGSGAEKVLFSRATRSLCRWMLRGWGRCRCGRRWRRSCSTSRSRWPQWIRF